MPRMIGVMVEGAVCELADNATERSTGLVKLTTSQARLIPRGLVLGSLDTTDRGSKGTKAKRWYRWFAAHDDVLACERATPLMRAAAQRIKDGMVW